ncbi:hypothetical protein QGX17_gp119 [Pseudomonas phage phiPsa381]|uniref:Uncharacterized protein n=4 Tax=Otagovirus TaxID=2560197 RepID=A0A7G9V1L4_9CAUD|nr:hypothetical protein QGX16_gp117 [Pseudomonas phage phiPsa397]YP_010767368.1 hypothetical protein QGX17_gp119 [Pseudomonas phage phiPsa381]YP_010767544.1 hypothetical protein QGX18_gp120 [Pseudomonas phage phiPsa347]YP_010767893.1 hypothetical protein QGX20_gp115 [Pseudomonas phage phiPsa300]QNO00170.1 hypothetical protein phiPsa300_107 [Pseudomonas phage phiPsa300]QNO00516.1 hypothetical protein phiPsa347_108 [Pseudomonas phage phiPsa347]QNO00686.1 hypothetical protein phiPsa381_105 [Pseu
MNVGDRIVVVQEGLRGPRVPADDNLVGWTGVITKVWPDGGLCVDLDPEQDPEDALDALHFEPYEVEVI